MTPTTRLTALDGLRGIAVTLVIADHSLALGAEDHHAFEPFHPGSFGVRLFFVLSGYLITGILIQARTHAEAADWPLRRVLLAFYLRRVLRIFPVAYLCILVAWLIGDRSVIRHGAWYLTYTQNILFADAWLAWETDPLLVPGGGGTVLSGVAVPGAVVAPPIFVTRARTGHHLGWRRARRPGRTWRVD